MGAHPVAPARAVNQATGVGLPLDELIAKDPVHALGAAAVREFGAQLPFLLKVLAASEPLSLQAHPTAKQAAAGFEREEAAGIPRTAAHRNYKDRHHKPELLCALGPFDALSGFRAIPDTLRLFDQLAVHALEPVLAPLRDAHNSEGLQTTFTQLLNLAEPAPLVRSVVAASALPSPHFARERALVERLAKLYPDDIGIVSALFLQVVRLEAGDAIYLGAGNLHAYLEGTGVEIMAASDNVLRGGLTKKHVDVPELLACLDFAGGPARVLRPKERDRCLRIGLRDAGPGVPALANPRHDARSRGSRSGRRSCSRRRARSSLAEVGHGHRRAARHLRVRARLGGPLHAERRRRRVSRDDPRAMKSDPLLAEIAQNPESDDARLVWADREGGERGELVVIQCALAARRWHARHERASRALRPRARAAREGVVLAGGAGPRRAAVRARVRRARVAEARRAPPPLGAPSAPHERRILADLRASTASATAGFHNGATRGEGLRRCSTASHRAASSASQRSRSSSSTTWAPRRRRPPRRAARRAGGHARPVARSAASSSRRRSASRSLRGSRSGRRSKSCASSCRRSGSIALTRVRARSSKADAARLAPLPGAGGSATLADLRRSPSSISAMRASTDADLAELAALPLPSLRRLGLASNNATASGSSALARVASTSQSSRSSTSRDRRSTTRRSRRSRARSSRRT